ncbi:MAG: inositol monophosphatase [Chitinophagaceae bacterium]
MLKSTLLQAVHVAADELRHFMNIEYQITSKEGINNLVTEADHAAEKAILETIKKNFPDHHILSEEVGEIVQDSNYIVQSIRL